MNKCKMSKRKMKLPKKIHVPKNNNKLKDYTVGWNGRIDMAKFFRDYYGDEWLKESLLRDKEDALNVLNRGEEPFYKGVYDCIVEIEMLNKEKEQRKEKLKGHKRLLKDFDVDIRYDGELWTSKEKDDEGYYLEILIKCVSPVAVSFYKRKESKFKDNFYILPDVIKAVNERLDEIRFGSSYINPYDMQ